jgi:hypothetical protein
MPGMPQLKKDQLEKIHTPTLYLLGGESDIAYKNGMDDFRRINHVPVFVANMDVGHGGTYSQPYGGRIRQGGHSLVQMAAEKRPGSRQNVYR